MLRIRGRHVLVVGIEVGTLLVASLDDLLPCSAVLRPKFEVEEFSEPSLELPPSCGKGDRIRRDARANRRLDGSAGMQL